MPNPLLRQEKVRPKVVLVVDDEPDILEMMEIRLKDYGCRVLTAENGVRALERLKEFPFDLVILDIMMPGMNGLDVLSEIKRDSRFTHIPVIMLTGKGDTASILEAQRFGASDFVMKPFEEKEFSAALRRVLF